MTFELDWRAFAYYEPKIGDWYVESGEFDILIGKSSEDIFKVPGGREAVEKLNEIEQ